jgi:hypothetical protein
MANISITDITTATNALIAARNRWALSITDINQTYTKVTATQINTLNNSLRTMKTIIAATTDLTTIVDVGVGNNVTLNPFTNIQLKSIELQNYCSCNCDRCTCDCNDCSCNCDRCTCDCAQCSCVDYTCPCTCDRCLIGCTCVSVNSCPVDGIIA